MSIIIFKTAKSGNTVNNNKNAGMTMTDDVTKSNPPNMQSIKNTATPIIPKTSGDPNTVNNAPDIIVSSISFYLPRIAELLQA